MKLPFNLWRQRWSAAWRRRRESKGLQIVHFHAALFFPVFLVWLTELLACCQWESLSSDLAFYLPGLCIIAALYGLLALLTRLPWVAGLLTALPFAALGICNYFKMGTINEPVLPSDLLLYKKAGEMAGFVKGFVLPPALGVGLALLILYLVFLGVFGKKKTLPRGVGYLCGAALLVGFLALAQPVVFQSYLSFFSLSTESAENQNVNFRENGLLGSFLINLQGLQVQEVQNYDANTAQGVLRSYGETSEPAESFQSPDVVVVLSEAFWDVRLLRDITFEKNPLATFDELSAQGVSGQMVSNTFGGGTVRPEFEILSGLSVANLPAGSIPYEQYLDHQLPSLGSFFHDLGYDTLGLHTFEKTFYNRAGAYPHMGFDRFLGLEDIPYTYEKSGGYVPDDLFANWIIDELKAADKPKFIMGISMENHGPYGGKYTDYDVDLSVNHAVDPITDEVFRNLTQGVYNADQALKKLTDYMKSTDRPTVLLYYGDHLPYLETAYSGFVSGGFLQEPDSALWTDEEALNMYATPYCIWSNYLEQPAVVPYVSPYQLGAMLLDYIDAPKTPFYRFLDDLRSVLPVAKAGYAMDASGKRVTEETMTEKQKKLLEDHWMITYDRLIAKEMHSVEP